MNPPLFGRKCAEKSRQATQNLQIIYEFTRKCQGEREKTFPVEIPGGGRRRHGRGVPSQPDLEKSRSRICLGEGKSLS